MNVDDLKPCPFCGGEASLANIGASGGCVICNSCQSEGPWALSQSESVNRWNSRASQWQPIETAPRDGKSILLTDGECVSQGGWLSEVDQGAEYEGQGGVSACWWSVACIEEPTHWMPLPSRQEAA